MSAPAYREYAPRAALTPFVHCVWTFTSPPDDTPQRIAPDGRPELIVHAGAPYMERGAGGDVVHLEIGEPDFDTPAPVLAAIVDELG